MLFTAKLQRAFTNNQGWNTSTPSVYGFSGSIQTVCWSSLRFSKGQPVSSQQGMTFGCASGQWLHCGIQPAGSFPPHPPGLPKSAPQAQNPASHLNCFFGLCRQAVGMGISASPGLPLQSPPGKAGFYRDFESSFGNKRHSNNWDFSLCTSTL